MKSSTQGGSSITCPRSDTASLNRFMQGSLEGETTNIFPRRPSLSCNSRKPIETAWGASPSRTAVPPKSYRDISILSRAQFRLKDQIPLISPLLDVPRLHRAFDGAAWLPLVAAIVETALVEMLLEFRKTVYQVLRI